MLTIPVPELELGMSFRKVKSGNSMETIQKCIGTLNMH